MPYSALNPAQAAPSLSNCFTTVPTSNISGSSSLSSSSQLSCMETELLRVDEIYSYLADCYNRKGDEVNFQKYNRLKEGVGGK